MDEYLKNDKWFLQSMKNIGLSFDNKGNPNDINSYTYNPLSSKIDDNKNNPLLENSLNENENSQLPKRKRTKKSSGLSKSYDPNDPNLNLEKLYRLE
jgi:hypothetical protein